MAGEYKSAKWERDPSIPRTDSCTGAANNSDILGSVYTLTPHPHDKSVLNSWRTGAGFYFIPRLFSKKVIDSRLMVLKTKHLLTPGSWVLRSQGSGRDSRQIIKDLGSYQKRGKI